LSDGGDQSIIIEHGGNDVVRLSGFLKPAMTLAAAILAIVGNMRHAVINTPLEEDARKTSRIVHPG